MRVSVLSSRSPAEMPHHLRALRASVRFLGSSFSSLEEVASLMKSETPTSVRISSWTTASPAASAARVARDTL